MLKGRLEYKWVALSNTTLGMLVAMINSSILLIALPDIFRGIGVEPVAAGEHELPAVVDPRLPGRDGGAAGEPRPARRHLRAGADVQPRLRGLHVVLDPALGHLDARERGCALADPDAGRAGRRRRARVRELERDPHRRVPEGPARARAGSEQHRDGRGLVHRARARRRARAGRVAARLPRLGAGRRVRDGLVVPQPARARRCGRRRGSTGGGTRPSRSAWSR